jgi:hypothetical protein
MSQTQRSVDELFARTADNTAGAISAEAIRDIIESLRPRYGEIVTLGSEPVVIDTRSTFVELTGLAWQLTVTLGFDMSAGPGRLTYVGRTMVKAFILANLSFSAAASLETFTFRILKNGIGLPASTVTLSGGKGGIDIFQVALGTTLDMEAGDSVSLAVQNDSSAADLTVRNVHITAFSGLA